MADIEPVFRNQAPQRSDPDTESFAAQINVLLRARWMLLLWGMIGVVAAVLVILMSERDYTSRAVIMPQSGKSPSLLAGLASQLNLSVATGGDVGQSSAFYADLIESRGLLGDAVDSRYNYHDGDKSHSGTLIDVFGSKGSSGPLRREAAIDQLAKSVDANVVIKTGVIQLSATLPSPDLAKQVTQRLIDLLDQFNRERRKSQASAERQFTQQRLVEVTSELRQAENRLEEFLQQNRAISNSPELIFQRDRLNNDVALRRELYASIAKAFEDVRLEEVRDTPVITVIEAPGLPIRADPRGAFRKLMFGLLSGLAFGVLLTLVRSASQARPTAEDPIAEFQRLRQQALGELLHPIAALRRTRTHRATGS